MREQHSRRAWFLLGLGATKGVKLRVTRRIDGARE
jgi:hypothetical protein